jgi:hypothetical protein
MPAHIPGVENQMTDIPSRSFGSNPEWQCCNDDKLHFSSTIAAILDRLPIQYKDCYDSDICGYYNGRVAATAQNWKTRWNNRTEYVKPMGLDPYLQEIPYTEHVCVLTGFAAQVQQGGFGQGQRIQAGTVTCTITAIGQAITLACGNNPTKISGSKKLLPQLQQTFDGWQKEDPPTLKKLPVEADVPEYLSEQRLRAEATELKKAVGDLTLISFYYLLRIEEYTVKGTCKETKQTVQFKYEDIETIAMPSAFSAG